MADILELRNIQKSFGEKEVLRGVTMRAERGKAFGLLGRNGAGKTTTIRILMGVFNADGGELLLDGKPLQRSGVRFGYLPEERGLYPKKKILDQLVYFAALQGMEKREAVRSVDFWLERLGMKEYREKRLDTLSKGNQQKIQLITALAHDPDIVILDEPFSGLDPVNALLLKEVVREESQKGKILFFSSHQMHAIEEFCDDIAILHGGKTVLTGDLTEIKRTYPRNRLALRSPMRQKILAELGKCCAPIPGTDDGLLLTLSSPSEKQERMRYLTEKYELDMIEVAEPSLSDIFIEYTGKEEQQGGLI